MGIDEFLNTKLSGVLFAIAMLIGWAVLWYNAGYSRGYSKGMRANPEKQETTNYIYADGRILRFVPGYRPIVIDLEAGTVTTVPTSTTEEEKK